MLDPLEITSHRGPYRVRFEARPFAGLEGGLNDAAHLIVDERVARLHADRLGAALKARSVLRVEANEAAKSLEALPVYARHLIEHGVRRDHELVAVGGGVVQDITAFLAATLLRGMRWRFYPTTLLAQADSCIGSKSSINVGPHKNQLGTFTPPDEIVIATSTLATLDDRDLRSGIGEMIKAHIIAGWEDTRAIARDYVSMMSDPSLLLRYVRRSLEIKRRFAEIDEFDRGPRLVMNYGHTFGHALESASEYRLPHGIAVTIGMDMANAHALRLGLIDAAVYDELHTLLDVNARGFEGVGVDAARFLAALGRDKKNVGKDLTLVLIEGGPGSLVVRRYPNDDGFREGCLRYLERLA